MWADTLKKYAKLKKIYAKSYENYREIHLASIIEQDYALLLLIYKGHKKIKRTLQGVYHAQGSCYRAYHTV